MNLRKEKAARIKVNVLDQMLKLIGKKSFDELYIDDLCAKVKISKVTLFKYFPRKEDILLYYFRVWCLARVIELVARPREGMQGIYFLFDRLSEAWESHPGLLLSMVGYIADPKRSPKPFPLKLEEKKLLFPHVASVASLEIESVSQMLERFVLEAIFKKEITKVSSTRDLTNLLTTVFMGSIITARMHQLNTSKVFFRRNVDQVIKGLN